MTKINDDAVYLIDGSGYIFRAYFAVRNLSNSKGVPTNAVFGFTNMLLKLIKDRKPKYLSIAFDTKEKNFRHKLYSDYKANRPPPPEDLVPQFPIIHQVVDAFNINRLVRVGYEADDVLGTAAKIAKESGKQVVIVTGDKDLMQLVDDKVFLLDELRAVKTGNEAIVDVSGVEAKFGVKPNRVADVLALAGDTSDNVPGVFGIGNKTAAALINEYGDLENLLNNLDEIKQNSRREKLKAGVDSARLSRKLVDIKCDIDLGVGLEDFKWQHPGHEKLFDLFRELEFKRLGQDDKLKEILDSGDSVDPALSAAPVSRELNATRDDRGYKAIQKIEELEELVKEIKSKNISRLAIDTETDGLDTMQAKLVGISLSFEENTGYYVPINHEVDLFSKNSGQIGLGKIIKLLEPVLLDPKIKIIAQNAKFDLNILVNAGFKEFQISGDPMLASYILSADQARHGLDSLSKNYLDHEPISFEEVCGKGRNKITFDKVEISKAIDYAAEDADLALRLANLLEEKIEDQDFEKLYDLELKLEEVLSRIERHGIKVDEEILNQMSSDFELKIKKLEEKACELAGQEFNLASPKQVGEILFDKMGIKGTKKTKSGYSTDSSVLESLSSEHEIAKMLLEFRMLSKLKGTYLDALPRLINPKTKRVHSSFNQFVAATGRLSSSDPNLQNIPIRRPEGRKIRDAFVAEKNNLLVSLDYSQIELRILAHVSQDKVMLDSFNRNQDVHRRTASEVLGIPQEEITPEQRSAAKAINFGLLYGMGVHKLGQTLGISRAEAKSYLDKYYERYSGIFEWQERLIEKAKEAGEVRTLLGRRRLLPDIKSSNRMLSSRAERMAINTPIQGSAADIIKLAMIEVDKQLGDKFPKSKMILQVHDELIIESPRNEIKAVSQLVSQIMSDVGKELKLDVPLVVDGDIGSSWGQAH